MALKARIQVLLVKSKLYIPKEVQTKTSLGKHIAMDPRTHFALLRLLAHNANVSMVPIMSALPISGNE